MPNRMIKKRYNNTSALQLKSCLSSLIALELLKPSSEMYLISPWLSNVPILENEFGQFRIISAGYGNQILGLADVLSLLSDQGCYIHLMTSLSEHNQPFLRILPSSIQVKKEQELHEKGWVTENFYLRGSMNFTYSGLNINSESVEISTDEQIISMAMVEARHHWEIT